MNRLNTRRRLKILFAVVLILVVVCLVGFKPLLRAAGNYLVVSDVLEPADAIVVLAGGDAARPLEAVHLYKSGFAPWVVVTTELRPRAFEQLKKDGIELHQTFENYLKVIEGYGVPQDRIIRIETPVADTLDEVERVRDLARERGWKRLLIVTSNFHTRRTRMATRHVLAPELHVAVVPSSQDSYDPSAWWKSQTGVRTFAIEAEKLVVYRLYLTWREFVPR